MSILKNRKGFTLLELAIVFSITLIIASIGAYGLVSVRAHKKVDVLTDSIAATLEQAKANAMAGKGGASFGVKFSTTTYIYFSGSTYNSSDTANISYPVTSGLTISAPASMSTSGALIFTRITGVPNANGTITVYEIQNASNTESISIGNLGDISVIK